MLFCSHVEKLKNKHANQRCFIVGNGPSINLMDLSYLKNEFVIGTNYSFFKKEIESTYICISDTYRMKELELYEKDLVDKTIFYASHIGPTLETIPQSLSLRTIPLNVLDNKIEFSWNIKNGVYCNKKMASVVFPAIQVAVYLGSKEVYLIGVDQDYSSDQLWFHGKQGQSHKHLWKENTMPSKDVIGHNYNYNYETQFKPAIETFDKILSENNIILANAGIGGKLNAITRVEYNSLFEKK